MSGRDSGKVYAFDPIEELISWCSCLVTPDQNFKLGVNRDHPATTLTGVVPAHLLPLSGSHGNPAFRFIWNGSLFTIPINSDEKR